MLRSIQVNPMVKNNKTAELASIIGTHRVHPFPARMAPGIALARLRQDKPKRVLDPMSGSGTTLVVARMLGHEAIGFDTDPLAVIIAKAWCHSVNKEQLIIRAEAVLASARHRYRRMTSAQAYPMSADDETKIFVRFWFDYINRCQLSCLSRSIALVRDDVERSLLWCAFSRMIITKRGGVSLAMDVSHSRPHRKFDQAPLKAFTQFPIAVTAVVRAAPFKNDCRQLKEVMVKQADARAIPLKDCSIDIVITSPPYLNAIDYMRGHKLSLVWLGQKIESLRGIRSSNIGSELSSDTRKDAPYLAKILNRMTTPAALRDKHKGMLARYVMDMDRVVSEIHRVLVPGGKATFIVGDSTLKGVFIQNSSAIRSLARQHGFSLRSQSQRTLPDARRYLPPPTAHGAGTQLQARMREEVILTFSKN